LEGGGYRAGGNLRQKKKKKKKKTTLDLVLQKKNITGKSLWNQGKTEECGKNLDAVWGVDRRGGRYLRTRERTKNKKRFQIGHQPKP